MIHPIKQIRSTIADIKDAFRLFIATVQNNTTALQALTAEQKQLRTKFDELVEHSRFQVRVKKQELSRAGHRAD
jgi:hypothetical protein